MKSALTIALMTVMSMTGFALGWPWYLPENKRALSMKSRESPLALSKGCVVEGRHYEDGASFNMGMCIRCTCRGGTHSCIAHSCAAPPCVDYVRDEDHCCGYCPNGPNCRGPKGETIQIGEEFPMPNSDLQCTCVLSHDGTRSAIACNFDAEVEGPPLSD